MPRYGRGLGHQPCGASKRVRPDALLRGSMLVKGDSGVPVIAMPTPPWLASDTSRTRSVLYLSLFEVVWETGPVWRRGSFFFRQGTT